MKRILTWKLISNIFYYVHSMLKVQIPYVVNVQINFVLVDDVV